MREFRLNKDVLILFGVTLMVIMNVSSIIPALPLIVQTLNIPTRSVGWLITVSTLPGVFLAPLVAVLADRFGRKAVLVPTLVLYGVFGAACFFAEDFQTLIVLRLLQGVGAGPLGVVNVTLLGDMFEGRERVRVMGYNGSVLSIGTAAFPAIGGALAQIGWNWPFLLALTALPLAFFAARSLSEPPRKKIPDLRAYLRAAAKGLLAKQPLCLFAVTLLAFIILYGPFVTCLPLLLDQEFAASPALIGLIFSLSSAVTALAASQLGRLSGIFRYRTLLLCGFVFYGLSMLLVPFMPSFWLFVLPITLFGFAQGLCIPSVLARLAEIAPEELRAAFMSCNGMVLRLSQTVAPMLTAAIMAGFGMDAAFLLGVGCAAGMLAIGLAAIE